MAHGIETRHSRGCKSREGGRCNCTPTYQAFIYDAQKGRKVRKTFPTFAAARNWRTDASLALRERQRKGISPGCHSNALTKPLRRG